MIQRITLLFFFIIISLGLFAAPHVTLLDTALAANTNIYLSKTGEGRIAIKPSQYNPLTDSVYFSQSLFDCGDITNGVFVFVKIYNKALTPAVKKYDRTTVIHPIDTSAPDISILSAYTLNLGANGTAVLNFSDIDLGTWDSCGVNYNGIKILSKTNYSCVDIGTASRVISVPDFHGNLSTATILLTVADNRPPVLALKNYPLNLSGAGSTTSLTFANINNNSTDNCGLGTATINGSSLIQFSCADTGTQKIVVVLNDLHGNSTKDSINLYVVDTNNPTYLKTPFNAYLNGNSASVSRANILSNVVGGCYPAIVRLTNDTTFTCADIATNPNYITFSVKNGSKTILDSVAVTVIDTTAPTLALKSDTLILVNGMATLAFSNVNNGVSDVCGVDSATVNGTTQVNYTCADTGLQKVIVVLFDINGNATQDSIYVFVADTVTPSYVKTPFTASLISNSVSVSRADILSNITGGCFSPTITFTSDTVFTCADVASNPHYISFVFSGGFVNVADSVAITVIDTTKPTLALKADTLVLVNNAAVLTFAQIDNGTADNCGLDSISLNGFSSINYTCADTGVHKIIVFSSDVNGNSSTDSVSVYVADTISPQYTKTPYTAYLGGDSVVVSRGNFLSNISGGCFTPAVAITSDTVFYCANALVNPNYITFTVGSGVNLITDSVAVTVADTLKPMLVLKSDTVYLAGATGTLTFANINNNSSDNCALDSATINGQSQFNFGCSTLGNQKVGVVLYDVSGNFSADSVTVFVVDTIAPTLALKSDTLILVNGSVALTFAAINNNSTDNCALDSATVNGLSGQLFTCADTGIQKIVVVLYDVNGNSSTDSVSVYVADTISPQYTKTPYTAYLGEDSVVVSRGNFLSNISGGCFTPAVAITSDTVFYCGNVASNPNYIRFSVVSGMFIRTDSVAITVLDTLKPTLFLQADTLILVNNMVSVNFASLNNGSVDNCALDTATLNGLSQLNYTCSDSGAHKIVVVLFDEHGNFSTDSVTIYVADTISPTYTKTPYSAYLQGDSVAVTQANILSNVAAGCFTPTVVLLGDTTFSCLDISSNPHYIQFSLSTGVVTVFDSVAVSVFDTLAPSLILISDTLILQNGSATVYFANVNNGSFDNCALDSALLNGQSSLSFSCATAGKNKIGVTLYDIYGNASHDSITVYVQDSVLPSYTKTPYSVNLIGNQATVSMANILSNISGGCSQPFIEILSDTTFNCLAAQTNPNYVLFAISNGSLWITDSVAVNVHDVTPPTMSIKPPPILTLGVNGVRVLTYSDLLSAFPSDNCGVDSIYIVPPTLTCANTASYAPIIITAFDASGNYQTLSTFAIAADITKPTLIAKNDTVYIDSLTGMHTLIASDVLDSMYDACGIVSVTFSKTNYTCADVGAKSVIVTATDFAGNARVSTANFYLADSTSPTFSINSSHTIYLDNSGQAVVKFADIVFGSAYDNCGITDTILSKTVYSCNDIGFDTLTVTLKDASGNLKINQSLIFIHDTVLPSLITQNISIPIDTNTGVAVISPWQLIVNASDNCGIDSNSVSVSKSVFSCSEIGANAVTVTVIDANGNTIQRTAVVNVVAAQISENVIVGEMQVCSNAYNVKYSIQNFNTSSQYVWTFDPLMAKVISTSYKGREVFVHWIGTSGSSTIQVNELNLASCGTALTDTTVTISGSAPDTTTIFYWNSNTKTTLVSKDSVSSYYQWGYDVYSGSILVSNPLVGETKNSYYNVDIASNISNLGYKYWCETSFDGQCWNRSYFQNNYPIHIPELQANETLLWPNPITNRLNITTSAKMTELQLSDMFGKVVYRKQVDFLNDVTLEDLDNLPAAGYVLTIKYAGGSISNHKIVRTK